MTSQKRTLFIINVNNVIDIITNSSSELFVLRGEVETIVKEMVGNIYPEYLTEYAGVKHINNLTNEQLDEFLNYHCSASCWPSRKSQLPVLSGFTFDELYEPEVDYHTGEQKKPAWNGEIQYKLRNNLPADPERKWHTSFVTDENRDQVIAAISKDVGNYFLYSSDQNPNWDFQEKLMQIGNRYHLG